MFILTFVVIFLEPDVCGTVVVDYWQMCGAFYLL